MQNVLHIYSIKDLDSLPQIKNEFCSSWVCLDFEKIMENGIDAIELHLSEEVPCEESFSEGLYFKLYGWIVIQSLL
jgi:hypothetical protein